MLPRVLEPEVMDTAEEAADYDAMDHAAVNRAFVDDLLSAWDACTVPGRSTVHVWDPGTGTALIPIELCQRRPEFHVSAMDLAAEMLKVAERNIASAGMTSRIGLHQADAKTGQSAGFALVMSNSLVHHIPRPRDIWANMVSAVEPGGLLFVRDLLRPATRSELQRLVQLHAGDANPRQRRLFAESLHASLTCAEVAAFLQEFDVSGSSVQTTSDRHWTVCWQKPV